VLENAEWLDYIGRSSGKALYRGNPQLANPAGAVDAPEGGIAWHNARIATLTHDGINAPSLPRTLRQMAPFPSTTVAPPSLIDVLCQENEHEKDLQQYQQIGPVVV
jgi:hypothetical protein